MSVSYVCITAILLPSSLGLIVDHNTSDANSNDPVLPEQVKDYVDQKISDVTRKMLELHGMCQVRYGEHCFFTEYYGIGQVNQHAAKYICEEKGAELGNIYSKSQYDKLVYYMTPWIAARVNEHPGFGVRTGMTINPQSKVVYMSDGSRAPYTPWATSKYPTSNEGATTVWLVIYPQDSNRSGMENHIESGATDAVLCQVKIK